MYISKCEIDNYKYIINIKTYLFIGEEGLNPREITRAYSLYNGQELEVLQLIKYQYSLQIYQY